MITLFCGLISLKNAELRPAIAHGGLPTLDQILPLAPDFMTASYVI
jgi:hypothetical protein